MLDGLHQTTNESESSSTETKKKFLKELKIPKLKLKPLVDDYKLALEKLKTELSSNNSNKKNKNRKRKIEKTDENLKNKKFKSIENKE